MCKFIELQVNVTPRNGPYKASGILFSFDVLCVQDAVPPIDISRRSSRPSVHTPADPLVVHPPTRPSSHQCAPPHHQYTQIPINPPSAVFAVVVIVHLTGSPHSVRHFLQQYPIIPFDCRQTVLFHLPRSFVLYNRTAVSTLI